MLKLSVEKCKYFRDAQTACSLMIDDLVPAAIGVGDEFGPYNDWGYFMDEEDSLYSYFRNNLINKYPEIRGTIFLPVDSHNYIPLSDGYTVKNRGYDDKFLDFLSRISDRFEFAFHGIKHSWDDESGKNIHEFGSIDKDGIFNNVESLRHFLAKSKLCFTGGKFPGYRYNNHALDFIRDNGFTWWALDSNMLNTVSPKNSLIWEENLNLTSVPTNLSGDIFSNYSLRSSKRRVLSNLIKFNKILHPEDYIKYLYDSGLPITIQEHFQNQTTKGRRQSLNIYDDIWSLERIYGLIRGLDIWHTTCGEIADYFVTYKDTKIEMISEDSFSTTNNDKNFGITLRTNCRSLIHLDSGDRVFGFRKNNYWIFDNIRPGRYKGEN